VCVENEVLLEPLDQSEFKECEEEMANQDNEELQEHKVPEELKEHREHEVKPECQE